MLRRTTMREGDKAYGEGGEGEVYIYIYKSLHVDIIALCEKAASHKIIPPLENTSLNLL
jgi:hypothetical protein